MNGSGDNKSGKSQGDRAGELLNYAPAWTKKSRDDKKFNMGGSEGDDETDEFSMDSEITCGEDLFQEIAWGWIEHNGERILQQVLSRSKGKPSSQGKFDNKKK